MPLLFPFFLALFVALFGSAFLPSLHLMAFSPFLALVYQKKRFVYSLWIALGCGLIMDLLTSQTRFGLVAINYLTTTLILQRQKRHFFEDRSLALCLFTFIISAVSTLIQGIFLIIAGETLQLSGKFFFTDLVLMPLFDALYALVWFIGPMKLVHYIQKTGFKKLFFKED